MAGVDINIPYTLRGIGDVYDSFDVMSGEYTKRIGSYTITGDESWSLSKATDNGYLYMLKNVVTDYDQHNIEMQAMCTHFDFVKTYNAAVIAQQKMLCNEISLYAHLTATSYVIYICSEYATVSEFKAMLQEQYNNGTPVVVYYWLAEPVVTKGTGSQVVANVPDTEIRLSGDLGSVKVTLQVRG